MTNAAVRMVEDHASVDELLPYDTEMKILETNLLRETPPVTKQPMTRS